MLDKINLVFLVGFLFSIYMMQGFLYPSGSIISQGILGVILLLGVLCFVRTTMHKNIPLPVLITILFFLLLSLTYVISPKIQYGWKYESIGVISTFDQFKNASAFLLLFFIGYYSALKQRVSRGVLTFVFIMQLVASIIMFYHLKATLLIEYDRESITVNAAYKFVVLIPFLPIVWKFIKNRIICVFIIIVMMFLIIMGSKRGAILCMLVSIVFIILYYLYHTQLSIKKIAIITVVVLFGCALLLYFVEQNEYLMVRLQGMEKTGIGARNIAYQELWRHWSLYSSIFVYFFGNGTCSSVEIWGNYAHNDWLELLTANGVLGVFLYLSLFLSFGQMVRKSSLTFDCKLSMYLCLIIWIMKSCFSMGYTDVGNGVYTLLLGVLTAKSDLLHNDGE